MPSNEKETGTCLSNTSDKWNNTKCLGVDFVCDRHTNIRAVMMPKHTRDITLCHPRCQNLL